MKQTRLLEIIREEISGALGETLFSGPDSLKEPKVQQALSKMQGQEKTDAIKGISTGTNPLNLEEEKIKRLAEKYQIDEETINEMASVVQTKKALEKLGDEKGLELVKNVERETLDQFKKSPSITSDGRLIRKLSPEEQKGKKDTRGYGADFERNFKKKAGMDFLDFTTDIADKFSKNFPGDKPFNAGLATNTTEKDAASQIFNLEKGQRGRKADPNKIEKTPKAKTPSAPKTKKSATLTKGDDGFDTVEYSDDEDAEAAKAVGSDETAKELGKVSTRKDKIVKAYQQLQPQVKDKIAQASAGDETAKEWLKNKWTPILQAYKKAQQVKI